MRLPASLLVVACTACEAADVDVIFRSSHAHRFPSDEKRAVARITTASIAEVRRLLPMLAARIAVEVDPGTNVIPEIGATASVGAPDTLFHELHHLARHATAPPGGTYLDAVIHEGLATAFERDFSGADPLWGRYPENVDEWVREIRALPPKALRRDWMFQHPDGRRWTGYKVGTYPVDRATRASGRSALELVSVPASEILRLAGVLPPPD